MSSCPSDEQLLCLLDDELDQADEDPIVAHVETCLMCQVGLDELVRDRLPNPGPLGEDGHRPGEGMKPSPHYLSKGREGHCWPVWGATMTTILKTTRPYHRRHQVDCPFPSWRRSRPRLEWTEDRTLLSAFLVTNSGDSGPGSLRQAILDSNSVTGGTNAIDFDIPGKGVQTIALISALPPIAASAPLDGTTQPGYSGEAAMNLALSNSGCMVSASNWNRSKRRKQRES
jgi:hypothetical protein